MSSAAPILEALSKEAKENCFPPFFPKVSAFRLCGAFHEVRFNKISISIDDANLCHWHGRAGS